MTLPEQLTVMHVLLRRPVLHIPSRGLSVTVPSPHHCSHQLVISPQKVEALQSCFLPTVAAFKVFFLFDTVQNEAYVTTFGGSVAHQPTTCCLFITSCFIPVALLWVMRPPAQDATYLINNADDLCIMEEGSVRPEDWVIWKIINKNFVDDFAKISEKSSAKTGQEVQLSNKDAENIKKMRSVFSIKCCYTYSKR